MRKVEALEHTEQRDIGMRDWAIRILGWFAGQLDAGINDEAGVDVEDIGDDFYWQIISRRSNDFPTSLD